MGRLGPWLITIIAIVAIFVDIPKHQFSFPFNCPGICVRIGDFAVNQEIKTHLGLDLQGGTQLILRMQLDKLPAGVTTSQHDLQVQAIRVIANPDKLRHLGPVSRTWHQRWSELDHGDGGVTPPEGAAS